MMVRWMCGVTLKNRITSDELRNRLSIEAVTEIVRRGRLRWFGMWRGKQMMIGLRSAQKWR